MEIRQCREIEKVDLILQLVILENKTPDVADPPLMGRTAGSSWVRCASRPRSRQVELVVKQLAAMLRG